MRMFAWEVASESTSEGTEKGTGKELEICRLLC